MPQDWSGAAAHKGAVMNLPCLGIDIAKVKLNVCLLQLNGKLKHKVFPNHAAGFAQSQEWVDEALGASGACLPGSYRHLR